MKTLLALVISVLSITTSYSQSYDFDVVKLKTGLYNPYLENYNTDVPDKYVQGMRVYYMNGVILMSDEAHSNYRVIKMLDQSDGCVTYTGTDEKDRDIIIILCATEPMGTLTIIYPKKYYISYYIK